MASSRPNPASRSDAQRRRAGRRRAASTPRADGRPGTVRIAVDGGDASATSEGDAGARRACPRSCAQPDAARLGRPRRRRRRRRSRRSAARSASIRSSSRTSSRATSGPRSRRPTASSTSSCSTSTYDDEVVATEIDIVLGAGLPAHGPRRRLGSARHRTISRGGIGADPQATGRTTCCGRSRDDIVDGYFPFADQLGDAIDDGPGPGHPRRRRPTALEQRVRPQARAHRGPPGGRARSARSSTSSPTATQPLIDPDELVYFRDIYDHVIRLTDELDNYRELASSTLDVYLTQVNNNLSVIMKRLTGVTVILAGIGAVAGIFGMSEAGAALRRRGGRRVLVGHRGRRRLAVGRGRRSSAGSTGSRPPRQADRLRRRRRGAASGARRPGRRPRRTAARRGPGSCRASRAGPSDVWSQSCSLRRRSSASSRSRWSRRTSVIS